jgi:hypothetical protein
MRKTRIQILALLMLLAGLTACGGMSPSTLASSTTTSSEQPSQTLTTAHFVFHYTAIDAGNIATTAARVEAEYARVLGDLGVEAMPPVHVTLYPEHRQLELATTALAGYVPQWTAGLVTSQTAIHMMSPNLSTWGNYDAMIGNIVHEFAHCVSLHINSSIANHPRWFWESVAIYESRQFVDPRTLSYMVNHQQPTFAQLDSIDDTRTYQIGYTIAEYVKEAYGADVLRELIVRNADTQAVLGVAQSQFERQWFDFVRQKYGI